jgi:hypothetical protein
VTAKPVSIKRRIKSTSNGVRLAECLSQGNDDGGEADKAKGESSECQEIVDKFCVHVPVVISKLTMPK